MKEQKCMEGAHRRLLPAVIIAAVMVLAAAAVLIPAAETDAATVDYVRYDGEFDTSPTLTAEIAAATDIAAGPPYIINGGPGGAWFYVKNNVDLGNNTLTISGSSVCLVIGADCTLKVGQGIVVSAGTGFSLFTEDPGTGNIGMLYATGDDCVKLGDGVEFVNTAFIYATALNSSGVRYAGGSDVLITNGVTGIISGDANGIYVTDGAIHNYGEITGGDYGIRVSDWSNVGNYAITTTAFGLCKGLIYGETTGIFIEGHAEISNSGIIAGDAYGYYGDHCAWIYNYEEGEIEAGAFGESAIATDGGHCLIENAGLIRGPNGINADYMESGDHIYNSSTGSIEGFDGHGIVVEGGDADGILIANYGGYIFGDNAGIFLGAPGNIYNNITSGVTGIIEGGSDGLFLDAGGMIYNEGTITGINSVSAYTDLTQYGLIDGALWLSMSTSNNVVFGAGSVIDREAFLGGNGTTLFFVKGLGDTSAPTLYATINGPVDMGFALVSVEDIRDLPAGYSGAEVILIDATSISGPPSNNTISLLAPVITLDLWIFDDRQLIAGKQSVPIVVPPLTDYKITASADSGSTISPAGISTVSGGSNKTFTFSAKPGYIISEVKIDGAFSLTQAEVNSGSYTFTNVTADHTIVVKSIAGTASNITLTVIVKEGNGYAEYNTGSGFVKYTGPIALTAGTNVQLRAVADDGFLFDKWETPGVETNSAIAINNIQSSKSVNLYFSSEDSGNPSSSNVIWYVLVIILILLVIFVVFFLWKRSKNKG